MSSLRDEVDILNNSVSGQSSNSNSYVNVSSGGSCNTSTTNKIPSFVHKEQWQIILGQDASISELRNAIERCKELVIETAECSPDRKWLVRHLVELRFRVREIEDLILDPQSSGPTFKVILGHHFVTRTIKNLPTCRQYCDHCSGIIWSVIQASYICSDCLFCVHHKCLKHILRVCAHIIASERKYPINNICPEIGLGPQLYKCAECQTLLDFKSSYTDARICDYSGLYYCSTCHWNDQSIIPSRIIHNWDFAMRKVCRASLQEISILLEKPCINLEQHNPRLFNFVQKLNHIKKLREDLLHMRKYLTECRTATEGKLLDTNIGAKHHLIYYPEMYSISDLLAIENGTMPDSLNKTHSIFEKHIRACEVCYGKGYHCEICGNNEIIFPFDDAAVPCNKCNSIYHRVCWIRKNMTCPKCIRLEKRRSLQEIATEAVKPSSVSFEKNSSDEI